MGLFSELFGLDNRTEPILTIPSIMPSQAVSQILQGALPILNVQTLMLAAGESCHFADKVYLLTERKEKVSTGKRSGWSIRVVKGVTYHTGKRAQPQERIVTEQTQGYLYITNKRIIFSAAENGFDRKIGGLTSIIPYSDGLGLQFGEKAFKFLLATPNVAASVIQMVK